MSKKKIEHNPPKKARPSFIRFTKTQQGFIRETRNRHFKEFNTVLGEVYTELGIGERILRAPPGTFVLREDYSGLDILPSPAARGGKKTGEKEEKKEGKKEKTH